MSVIKVDKTNFNDIKNSDKKVLLDFYADWCGPCKMISPIIDEIAKESTIDVAKVNVDKNQNLAAKYSVMSIPTLLVFRDGKIVNQMVGAKPKNQILAMIK